LNLGRDGDNEDDAFFFSDIIDDNVLGDDEADDDDDDDAEFLLFITPILLYILPIILATSVLPVPGEPYITVCKKSPLLIDLLSEKIGKCRFCK
jgi:hypothetical protein